MTSDHPILQLILHKTYYEGGYFNVPVSHDQYIRPNRGPVRLVLDGGPEIEGMVYRTANGNGTARVFGRKALRDWFQAHYSLGDAVLVDFETERRLRLGVPTSVLFPPRQVEPTCTCGIEIEKASMLCTELDCPYRR